MTYEVLRIEAALRSPEINNVKIASSPNDSEHEPFCADLLPRPFWCLFAMDARVRGAVLLKREPPLITRVNDAFLNFCDSELLV
jgi:hypothetical protein